jgi:HAD superfamily hydrolase (TIGR01450 family)
LHDGYKPFLEAVQALQTYRASGGLVILVTNAPRHSSSVEQQIKKIGIEPSSWDAIATSGDSARHAMFSGVVGRKVYFIGQPHDMNFFDLPTSEGQFKNITLVPLKEADGIVCCGPFDPLISPSENLTDFEYARESGLKLLCANPDIVVDRGDTREWCAGALAAQYTKMGGKSLYFGKPHKPIYDLARVRLRDLDSSVLDSEILCIGDGISTDIKGAIDEKLDSLFISGGLAATETGTKTHPNEKLLNKYLEITKSNPTWVIGRLN